MIGLLAWWYRSRDGRGRGPMQGQGADHPGERLRVVAEVMGLGTWEWDIPNRELHWDEAMFRLYGLQAGDSAGDFEAWIEQVLPEDRERMAARLDEVLEGGAPFREEFRIRRPDGSIHHIQAVAMVFRDETGRPIRMVGANHDVTEQRQVEAEVRALNAQLEARVLERTEALQRANEALVTALEAAEAATRAKSDFLANMSHEVRTPMNAILGMNHLALQEDLPPKLRGYLTKTRVAADTLFRILNDILDFSKMEAGRLDLEVKAFRLEEVVEEVTALVAGEAVAKQLELLMDLDPRIPDTLMGDPHRLAQVLTHLCGNAVKFTDAGEVVLEVRAVPGPDPGRVELAFSVRDTGIGMSAGEVEGLFRPFGQMDTSSTRRFAGTGMGLAISQRLVALMGGDLQVTSTPGRGSAFGFRVAFGVAASAPAPVQRPSVRRVLVVDDCRSAREILKALLGALGCEVEALGSADAAIGALQRPGAAFDVVFLDWQMPGVDGFEAARRIRALAGEAGGPRLVLISAYGDDELRHRAHREGFDGCLAKPVTPSTLMDTLRDVLEGAVPLAGPVSGVPGASGLEGAQILVVEDNEFNQLVAMELLLMQGAEAVLAAHGREAVEKVRSQPFDAVLMDLQMPVMDGYEATRLIRAEPAFASLPILALTAHAFPEERARCLALGMDDYLVKPIEPGTLYAALGRWVRPRPAQAIPAGPERARAAEVGPLGLLPGISQEVGLSHFNGDAGVYGRMLRRFLDLRGDAGEELRRALAASDLQEAGRVAHMMIAGAGSIGALGLSAASLALETALRAGDPSAVPPLVEDFQRELAEVAAGIRAFAAGPGAP